ncbi:MAG: 50S ribosomal protein L29 [Anaerolineales bacterium]|nr:50S ribosomal protein L29 [Anaerolineales bacterium]
MKSEEIRALADEEIQAQIDETREEMMNLRFQQSTGELSNTSRITETRRLIARFETILRERELEAAVEGEL